MTFEKRRESLLKKSINHIIKSQFYVVKSSFKNWIQKVKILEREDELKKEKMRVSDLDF